MARSTSEDQFSSAWQVGRILRTAVDMTPLVVGVLAGAMCGVLILGGGARVAMRVVALVAGLPVSFTWSGTLGLLVGGGMAGALLGLLYLPVQRWLPGARLTKAALYGLVAAGLFSLAFVGAPEGEFALVAPWIGIGLFAPLPVLYSVALAVVYERRMQRAARRTVTLGHLALFCGGAAFAFSGMATVLDSARVPPALLRLVEDAGVPFHQTREALAMLYMLLTLVFLGLHVTAFWLGSEQRPIRWLGLGQLLLAGLLLRATPLWAGLAQTDAGHRNEWLGWGLLALGMIAGLVSMERMRRRHPRHARAMWAWLMAGVALFVGGVLAMWLAVLVWPDLHLRGWTAAQTMFAVAPLPLPWLALPAALIGAARASALPPA